MNLLKTMITMVTALGMLTSGTLSVDVNAAELKNARAVKVAILDSGSNADYQEGISLIDGTVRDQNGHGTLMAGIVREIYPDAELYIIKVIGRDGFVVNERSVILGIEWALSRDVDVINMSLRLRHTPELHAVIKKAYDKGTAVIAAAGNKRSDRNAALSQNIRTAESDTPFSTSEVAYPARYSEVIAVGALDRYGRVFDESIEGEEVAIHIKGYKGRKAGTSIASAYASGLAAKIFSENPGASAQEIKNIMKKTLHGGGMK